MHGESSFEALVKNIEVVVAVRTFLMLWEFVLLDDSIEPPKSKIKGLT
jgi:hypothetical protein